MEAPLVYTVVTTASSPAQRDAFVAWLVGGHVRDVCDAGAISAEVFARDDGVTIEARYTFASREAFVAYERDHAPRLRAEGLALFPEGLAYTRSIGTPVFSHTR